MASISMDIATTFLGLAKRHPTRLNTIGTAVFPVFRKHRIPPCRAYLTCCSTNSRTVSVNWSSKPKPFSCRFTTSAAATTSTPQSEDSDVSTKIPPDDRIPATIITGFLGSGKVKFPLCNLLFIKILVWKSNSFV